MRVAVHRSSANDAARSTRGQSTATATAAPPVAQDAQLPQAQPPADLVALQRIVAARPGAGGSAPVEPRGPAPPAGSNVQAEASPAASTAKTDNKLDLGDPSSKAEISAIRLGHAAEIQQIIRHLKGKTYDSDVDAVCDILHHWDSTTITASWSVIGKEWLDDLIDNVSEQHFQRHARVLAASYKALPAAERLAMVLKLTDEGAFSSVSAFDATRVLYLIQGFPASYLATFIEKDEGKRYRRFVNKLPGAEKAALERSLDREHEEQLRKQELARRKAATKEEEARAGIADEDEARKDKAEAERKAALRQKTVSAAIARIEKLLWTGFTDWAVTDAEAHEVFSILKGISDDPAVLGVVVRHLEAKSLVETWIGNMPEKELYRRDYNNAAAFIKILSFRPPEAAVKHAIKLLSYKLFDWAVTDEDAILAYHLIRALPASVQHDFKMRDNGKWFVRMEHNLEQAVITGKKGYLGEDEKAGYGLVDDDSERAALERAQDTRTVQENETALRILSAQIKNCSSDNAAAELAKLTSRPPEQVRAFVRHLDRTELIEPLLDKLGHAGRWAPENAKRTLTVLRYRDPAHNIAMITDLLSYGIFDWEITKEEARLAYEIIKALPAKTRDELIAQDPKWFARIDENISLELRKSSRLGFYEGSETDRAKLLGKLLDPRIWKPEAAGHLEVVLRMIRQAGLVEDASPLVQARWTKDHAKLLTRLGYVPTGSPPPESIVDRTDVNTVKQIVGGVAVAASSEKLVSGLLSYGFLGRGEVRGVKMDKVQDAMGGHLFGIEFGKSTDLEQDKDLQDTGEIDLEIDEQRGLIRFLAGNLPVNSVNILDNQTTVRAGEGQIAGADIIIKWATTVDPVTFLAVDLDRLLITNLLFVRRDRMFGIGRIELTRFKIRGQRPTGDGQVVKTKAGLLADIGRVFYRIIQMLAGLVEALPLVGDIAPLNPLFDAGDEPGIAEQISTAFSKHFNLSLEIGGLTVADIVDSRGGRIEEVKLGKTSIELTMSQAARHRQAIEDLRQKAATERRKLSTLEEAQIVDLTAKARAWEAKESRKAALEAQRRAEKGISETEKQELDKLTTELDAAAVTGRVEGGLAFKGVDFAGVKADELALDDVTLAGTAAGLAGVAGGYLTKEGQAASLASITTVDKPGLADRLSSPGVSIKAGRVTGKNVGYTSSVRRDEALDAVIQELERKEKDKTITEEDLTKLEAARREREAIKPQLDAYKALVADLAALTPDKLQKLRELEAFLAQPPLIQIAGLKLKDAELGGSISGRSALFKAGSAELTGVEAGGIKLDRATATGLSLGIGGGGATLDATSITLAGLRLEARVAQLRASLAALEDSKQTRALSTDEASELQRTQDLLRQYDAIASNIDELERTLAARPKDAPEDWKTKNELARRRAELKSWQTTAKVDEITVDEAHVQVTGLGDVFKEGYKLPTGGLTVASSRKGAPILGKVTAKGVELDGKKLGDIELDKLGGQIKILDEDTIRIEALAIERLAIAGVHIDSPGMKVDIDKNVEIKGVEVTATLTWGIEEQRDQEGKLTGARHRKLQDIFVESLHVDSIAGTGIHVDIADTVTADLDKGVLSGIDVKDLRFAKGALQSIGSADIASTDFAGLKKLVASGITASAGKLATGKIHFDTIANPGKFTASLADITGDDIVFNKPGLGMTIKRLRKGAVTGLTYDRTTGDIGFPDVKVGELELSRVLWASGTKSVNVRKKVLAKDITVSGYLKMPPAPKAGTPVDKTKPAPESKLFIKLLTIGRADVEGTDYADTAVGRDIKITKGYLEDIQLRNFDADAGTLGLHLGETSLTLGESQIKKGLSATGDLHLGSLDVGVLGTNHTKIKLVGLSTKDLLLQFKDDKNVNVLNLGGTKDVGGDIELIGDKTILRGMDLGLVRVSKLDWTAGSKHITSDGAVELSGVKLDAVLEQGPDGLRQIAISKLHIDRVVATHLKYQDGDTTVVVNKDKLAVGGDLSIVNVDLADFAWDAKTGVTGGKLDVQTVDANAIGAQLGKKLKVDATAHASGLSVEFEKDGKVIAEVKKLGGTYDVDLGDSKKVGGSFADIATGKVTIGQDFITIPNLAIGNITVNELRMNGPDYVVLTRPGGSLALNRITANVTIALNSPEDVKKGAPAVKQVRILSLVVPETKVKAIDLYIGKQIKIAFPDAPEGTITNIKLEGFDLTAPKGAGDWGMAGRIRIEKLDFKKLGVDLGATFKGKTDISASDLKIDLFSMGGRTIEVPTLDLANVDGKLSGTPLLVTKGSVKGLEIDTNVAGETSIKAGRIEVGGIDFNSPLVRFQVEKALLPKGFVMPRDPGQPIEVDQLEITKATFDIKDIPALRAGGGASTDESGSLQNLKFLDTIDGNVTAKIHFEGSYGKKFLRDRKADHKLDIRVTKGVVDLYKLEAGLSGLEDAAVDFQLRNGKLALNVGAAFWTKDVITWDLTAEDKKLIEHRPAGKAPPIAVLEKIHVSTLAQPKLAASDPNDVADEMRREALKAKKAKEGLNPKEEDELADLLLKELRVDVLDINDIVADLNMKGPSVIDLGTRGKILLGDATKDGVNNLHLTGALSKAGTSRGLDLSIGSINASLENFKVDDIVLNTKGGIEVTSVHDVHIDFDQLSPKSAHGVVDKAVARGIRITLPKKK